MLTVVATQIVFSGAWFTSSGSNQLTFLLADCFCHCPYNCDGDIGGDLCLIHKCQCDPETCECKDCRGDPCDCHIPIPCECDTCDICGNCIEEDCDCEYCEPCPGHCTCSKCQCGACLEDICCGADDCDCTFECTCDGCGCEKCQVPGCGKCIDDDCCECDECVTCPGHCTCSRCQCGACLEDICCGADDCDCTFECTCPPPPCECKKCPVPECGKCIDDDCCECDECVTCPGHCTCRKCQCGGCLEDICCEADDCDCEFKCPGHLCTCVPCDECGGCRKCTEGTCGGEGCTCTECTCPPPPCECEKCLVPGCGNCIEEDCDCEHCEPCLGHCTCSKCQCGACLEDICCGVEDCDCTFECTCPECECERCPVLGCGKCIETDCDCEYCEPCPGHCTCRRCWCGGCLETECCEADGCGCRFSCVGHTGIVPDPGPDPDDGTIIEDDPVPLPVYPDPPPPLTMFVTQHVAYIIGYPDGNVRPERSITRAEVATVFFRLLTEEIRAENWTQENSFSDVSGSAWYNNAISVVSEMGILDGYPDGTFKPDRGVSRAELATIAARFARQMQLDSGPNERGFNDISGHWAEEDIIYAASFGWFEGYEDGTFRPNASITRAEFMTLANRMLQRVPQSREDILVDVMVKWVDNADPEAWYYLAVQEATNTQLHEFKDERVAGLYFPYKYWVELLEDPDWAALERQWVEGYSR